MHERPCLLLPRGAEWETENRGAAESPVFRYTPSLPRRDQKHRQASLRVPRGIYASSEAQREKVELCTWNCTWQAGWSYFISPRWPLNINSLVKNCWARSPMFLRTQLLVAPVMQSHSFHAHGFDHKFRASIFSKAWYSSNKSYFHCQKDANVCKRALYRRS